MKVMKEISELEMARYIVQRLKKMKVSNEVFLESGTMEQLKKTYYYLREHENITEVQLVKDLNYQCKH